MIWRRLKFAISIVIIRGVDWGMKWERDEGLGGDGGLCFAISCCYRGHRQTTIIVVDCHWTDFEGNALVLSELARPLPPPWLIINQSQRGPCWRLWFDAFNPDIERKTTVSCKLCKCCCYRRHHLPQQHPMNYPGSLYHRLLLYSNSSSWLYIVPDLSINIQHSVDEHHGQIDTYLPQTMQDTAHIAGN